MAVAIEEAACGVDDAGARAGLVFGCVGHQAGSYFRTMLDDPLNVRVSMRRRAL